MLEKRYLSYFWLIIRKNLCYNFKLLCIKDRKEIEIRMNSLKPMLLTSLKSYSREQFFKDVTAGIIVAIIALPLSIALALASGVGPEAGIFTAIVAGFVISALGADCWSDCSFCDNRGRNCGKRRTGWSGHCDSIGRCVPVSYGTLPFWNAD